MHPDPLHDVDQLFEAPSRWRAQAALALGISGEELLAGVSSGASCPTVLHSVLAGLRRTSAVGAVPVGPAADPAGSSASCGPPNPSTDASDDSGPRLDLLVDVGGGVGGISEWFRRRTGATVVVIEPARGARDAAAALFPVLRVRPGSATCTGMPDAVADAVLLSGVLSLVDDLGRVVDEAERIVRPGGAIAVTDLFAVGGESFRSGPNVFRTLEAVAALFAARGWTIVEVGFGTPSPDPAWAAAGARVDEWIRAHRCDHDAFATWQADGEHLSGHVDDGDLVAGCIVVRR